MSMKMPKGKYMATVKVGEKGQIVIPKGARELFGIEPGDTLLLMADVKQGIAIVQNDAYMKFVDAVFSVQQEPPVAPDGELEAEKLTCFLFADYASGTALLHCGTFPLTLRPVPSRASSAATALEKQQR